MFTGLIEDVGKVVRIAKTGAAASLTIETSFLLKEIRPGDSIAVNGVCLTVVEKGSSRLVFDVSHETIERTAFAGLKPGHHVNLERALRLGDRLGGHMVSGHVDCIASIVSRREISGNFTYEFRLPEKFARYIIEKGSVAVDGISLTVNAVSTDGFSLNVIPHTDMNTNLRYKKPGDEVNIETDMLGKYIERLLSGGKAAGGEGGVTMELLAKNGYL